MEDGFVAWQTQEPNIIDDISAAHHNSNTWLMRSGGRQEAERLLANMPTGTFLIRRRDAGHYALSITCNSATNHCLIYETDKGYGFALPYNIYDSLMSLVLHYAQNSLEEHNDALTTTLKYPVYSDHIVQYRQKQQQQQQFQKKIQMQQFKQSVESSGNESIDNGVNNDVQTKNTSESLHGNVIGDVVDTPASFHSITPQANSHNNTVQYQTNQTNLTTNQNATQPISSPSNSTDNTISNPTVI